MRISNLRKLFFFIYSEALTVVFPNPPSCQKLACFEQPQPFLLLGKQIKREKMYLKRQESGRITITMLKKEFH